MIVGFTGTRDGMTDEQRRAFIAWMKDHSPVEMHNGCCVGADEDAADVAMSAPDLGFTRPRLVAHPPTNRSRVCESVLMFADETRPDADYLARNQAIVDACDVLLACPKGSEKRRSGTWATVRYARRVSKPVILFLPDGTVSF
jgi:hypothetical protein